MLAIKIYRVDAKAHLYVLYGTVAPDKSVTYAGGGVDGPWNALLERSVPSVPSATKVVLKLHDAMKREPVWRVDIPYHDALVEALMKDSSKRIVEVVPKYILNIFKTTRPLVPLKDDYRTRLDLFPYQKAGIEFIVNHYGRGIIADEMGLGKTYQGLGVLEYYKSERPALIICPAAVKASWWNHLKTHFPDERLNHIQTGKDDFDKDSINLLSYGMLSSATFQAKMNAFRPAIIIVDESHYIKTAKADRTKRVFQWSKLARRVILLTGTPMNKPHELYSQIKCVDRTLFSNFFHYQKHLPTHGLVTTMRAPASFYFASRYCSPELREVRGHSTFAFKRAENESELHAILKERVMIRRTKQQVLPELPPKIRERVFLDAWEQPGLKEQLNVGDKEFMERVRETAQHKLDPVVKYLKEIVAEELKNDPTLKVIVWSHHHFMLDALADVLPDTVVMDGRTSAKTRAQRVEAFQTDPKVRVAVMGLSAMCTGVTMTKATLEIVAELVFSPDVHLQAEDRACRIGQEFPVTVRYMYCSGTTDEIVWKLLEQKVKNTAQCVDGGIDAPGWKRTRVIRTHAAEDEPVNKKPNMSG